MATASTVQLSPGIKPQYHTTGGDADAASTASQLLQENHDAHHIFFNESGFHNHIAHHLLTLWALRATPTELQRAYDANKTYQRAAAPPTRPSIATELRDPDVFMRHLGPGQHYNDFLAFFTAEIAQLGWQRVLQTYLFARNDARAQTMLVRLHSGFLHPLIHLGFGIEFEQPAIIAEALAQAACHDEWIGELLLGAEELQQQQEQAPSEPAPSIVSLLDAIRADPDLVAAPRWTDANKIRDGVLARAGKRMVALAARVRVRPTELARAAAEMTNAAAYYTAGAQRADKMVRFDFYFMHCVNSAVFYPAFLRQAWLADADKARLLEWKIRMDLAMYASRRSPPLRLADEVRAYAPRQPSGWDGVERRVCALAADDGHAAKLVRAVASGRALCEPFDRDDAAFRLKQDDWLLLAHMVIDSVEAPGDTWVRSAGWDEAWEGVPARL